MELILTATSREGQKNQYILSKYTGKERTDDGACSVSFNPYGYEAYIVFDDAELSKEQALQTLKVHVKSQIASIIAELNAQLY